MLVIWGGAVGWACSGKPLRFVIHTLIAARVSSLAQQGYGGRAVSVSFEAFVRPEQKFAGLPALTAQLERDRATAVRLLGEARGSSA